jgi:hypothetical protein
LEEIEYKLLNIECGYSNLEILVKYGRLGLVRTSAEKHRVSERS